MGRSLRGFGGAEDSSPVGAAQGARALAADEARTGEEQVQQAWWKLMTGRSSFYMLRVTAGEGRDRTTALLGKGRSGAVVTCSVRGRVGGCGLGLDTGGGKEDPR